METIKGSGVRDKTDGGDYAIGASMHSTDSGFPSIQEVPREADFRAQTVFVCIALCLDLLLYFLSVLNNTV